jgi:microcystin-dependent protein
MIIGEVILFAGGDAPPGTLFCNGAAVSRTTYSALFGVISTIHGVGDGTTTFNLPDLRGRVVVGSGSGQGLTNRNLGDLGGAETHALTTAELAAHRHRMQLSDGAAWWQGSGTNAKPTTSAAGGTAEEGESGSTGSGTAHNNMMPFYSMGYYICYEVATVPATITLDANQWEAFLSALTE